VFLLEPQELAALERPEGLATLLAQRREERRRLALLALPHTADLEAIRAAEGAGPHLRGSATPGAQEAQADPWLRGVGLGQRAAHGRVLLASDLVGLLEREREAGRPLLDRETILVATALEPAWAVVFGRVGGVVTELGGELSHVAILLREAGVPALLDVRGATARLVEGERVLLEPAQGRLRRLDRAEGSR
jgi:phosphohistidine swiveling domain-containing protein